MAQIEWTNPSVKRLGGNVDPASAIIKRARMIVLKAMDDGWQGPPFDVFSLAQRQGLSLVPREDVLDARLIAKKDGIEIEYNPNRSLTRIRFSVAHEIAHTLFPDYEESIHNRAGESQRPDEWQLELLCNIAAAEILMPAGPYLDPERVTVTIDKAVEIRDKFGVSLEAALLRLGKFTTQPITIFAAAREKEDKNADFRIDYAINSPTSNINLRAGMRIPIGSVLSECTAIGFTAKKREKWYNASLEFDVECVGVAPYPGHVYPRVIGIVRTKKKPDSEPLIICYLIGDATEPRGEGQKIIAHIVNDSSKNWGRGFGRFVADKWPDVTEDFRKWAEKDKKNLRLGNSHIYDISDDLHIFHMVAQRGYGPSETPRIKYGALARCLLSLSQESSRLSATVHLPRIGTGYAGGNWSVVSELIDETLVKQGVAVTVYDLPGRERPGRKPTLLDFDSLDNW